MLHVGVSVNTNGERTARQETLVLYCFYFICSTRVETKRTRYGRISVEAISREMTQREDYMQEKLEVDGMCEASC